MNIEAVSNRPLPERVFLKIDRQVKGCHILWDAFTALSPLYPKMEKAAQRDAEPGALRGVFANVLHLFPDEIQAGFRRHQEIRELLHGENPQDHEDESKNARFNSLFNEASALLADPEISFLHRAYNLVESIIERRQQLRALIQERGTNRSAYDDLIPHPYASFRGHVERVVPQRFSIGLYVDQKAFDAEETQEATGAFFPPFRSLFYYAGPNFPEGISIGDRLNHEDFHALVSLFRFIRRPQNPNHVERVLKNELTNGVTPGGLRRLRRYFNRTINGLSSEELAAELVSEPIGTSNRQKIPAATFARETEELVSVIAEFVVKQTNQNVISLLLHAQERLDINKFREQLQRLYSLCPAQLHRDLDILFLLLPTRTDIIEQMIERWKQTRVV